MAYAVFFTRDLVAATKAPERAHAHLRPFLGQARFQLGQGNVGHLGQRRVDQISVGLGSMREPITPLWFGPGITASSAHPLPTDGAGGAHAKLGRRLAAG